MTYAELKYRCPKFLKETLDSIDGDERFVVTMFMGAGLIGLCSVSRLSGGEFIVGLGWIFTSFVASKAVEHVAESTTTAKVAEAASAARVAEAQ